MWQVRKYGKCREGLRKFFEEVEEVQLTLKILPRPCKLLTFFQRSYRPDLTLESRNLLIALNISYTV